MSYKLDRLWVMVIDDNRHMLTLITEILRGLSIRGVTSLSDPADAFREMRISNQDLVITDHAMSPISGIEFVHMMRTSKDSPDRFMPVIMTTGYSDTDTVKEARDAGVTEFLAKPISARDLYLRILQVIDRPRPFIKCKTFFGPDRRRHKEPFEGIDRRKIDPETQDLPEGVEMFEPSDMSGHLSG